MAIGHPRSGIAWTNSFRRYWLKQHLFCRGAADRFSALLSWTALNEHSRASLARDVSVPAGLSGARPRPGIVLGLEESHTRIRAKDVTDQLRRGATLSFDGDRRSARAAHAPEPNHSRRSSSGGTQINIYAAWRALHGLDLHRDNQEIFILQLDGRKRWLLYGSSVDEVDRQRTDRPFGATLWRVARPDPRTRRPLVHPQGLLSRRGADERAGAPSDGGCQEPPGEAV